MRCGRLFHSTSHPRCHFPSSALTWRHTSSNCVIHNTFVMPAKWHRHFGHVNRFTYLLTYLTVLINIFVKFGYIPSSFCRTVINMYYRPLMTWHWWHIHCGTTPGADDTLRTYVHLLLWLRHKIVRNKNGNLADVNNNAILLWYCLSHSWYGHWERFAAFASSSLLSASDILVNVATNFKVATRCFCLQRPKRDGTSSQPTLKL